MDMMGVDWKRFAKGAAKGMVTAALTGASADVACCDRAGQSIYERETGKRDWASLDATGKAVWVARAQSAILGLRAFIKEG